MTSSCSMYGEDLTAIPNNRHESSKDTNPYSYPYFHASDNGSGSVLYDLVVEFAGHWKSGDLLEQRRLVRSIEARCFSSPSELFWTDSCGDTALHRLAQMSRHAGNVHFLIQITKYILDADATAVTAQNNWKETPLHQFAAHCGMPHHLSDVTHMPAAGKKNPMLEFVGLLCQRDAASLANYKRCFPLHDAVEIAQVRPGWMSEGVASSPQVVQFLEQQHADIVQMLASATPLALETLDAAHRQTPLFRALLVPQTSPLVFQVLLDKDRASPAKLRQRVTLALGRGFGLAEANEIRQMQSADPKFAQFSPRLGPLWRKTQLLCQRLSDKFLHGLLLSKAPACAIALCLATEKDAHARLLETDQTGQLPWEILLNHEDGELSRDVGAILHLLTDAHSDVAKTTNSKGQLPLHLALTAGLSWSQSISDLFHANPLSVTVVDPVSKLYPFQLAANADETTIVEILRADPSLVRTY